MTIFRCDDIGCTEHPGDDPQSLASAQRADRAAYAAGCAYRDGQLDRAAHLIATAMGLDPDRRDLWESRAQQVIARADRQGLRAQVAVRLLAAGIDANDPGLQQVVRHNQALGVGVPEREGPEMFDRLRQRAKPGLRERVTGSAARQQAAAREDKYQADRAQARHAELEAAANRFSETSTARQAENFRQARENFRQAPEAAGTGHGTPGRQAGSTGPGAANGRQADREADREAGG
jgi:hypothetical protein